jgi:MFS family permease
MFLIMVGNGLQGTLLSLRAENDGFPVSIIGVIMSLYFIGYLFGWYTVPKMVESVGHIRVFAAFASMASTTILIQGLFVNPWAWGAVRMIAGLSFVGLFIIAESWLNDMAPNKSRGQVFSLYMFVVNAGAFAGQFLINIAPIENIHLFILVSVLVSFALLPITLANKPSPGFEETEKMPFKNVVKTSPFSVACVLSSGFLGTAMLTMGSVYAKLEGFGISQIALFLALFVLGASLIPLGTGYLSDRVDRRKAIIGFAFCGFLIVIAAFTNASLAYIAAFLFGGCVTSIHSSGTALINDRISAKQRTSATATLILINGISSSIAPIAIGSLMQFINHNIFFPSFAVIFFVLMTYGIIREFAGPAIDVKKQRESHALTNIRATPGAIELADS